MAGEAGFFPPELFTLCADMMMVFAVPRHVEVITTSPCGDDEWSTFVIDILTVRNANMDLVPRERSTSLNREDYEGNVVTEQENDGQ